MEADLRVHTRDRIAAAFLVALMFAGSFVLWIAVPYGGMWLAGELTDSFGLHMPLALILVIPGMFLVAIGLAWTNELHQRVTGGATAGDRAEYRRSRHGPLEPILAFSFVLALVALFVWFFLFAENPPRGVF